MSTARHEPLQWVPSLRNALRSSMYRYSAGDRSNQYFITIDDLKLAWRAIGPRGTPLQRLRHDVSFFVHIDDQAFWDSWIRVTSVLIWIKYDMWPVFLSRCEDLHWTRTKPSLTTTQVLPSTSNIDQASYHTARFRDPFLPFTKEELYEQFFDQQNADEAETARFFFDAQFAFAPIVLEKDKHVELEEENCRLPLISEGQLNETGSYGRVTKVRIAKNYYRFAAFGSAAVLFPEVCHRYSNLMHIILTVVRNSMQQGKASISPLTLHTSIET